MVTHDPVIGAMADRRIELEHGRISTTTTFSFEEETGFDEVLEQVWVMEEDKLEPRPELLQFNGGGNWKVLPVMKEIGLLKSGGPALEMTEQGRERSARIIRRHRLAERLFSDTFDMQDDQQLESNACTFEHILSPEVTERICTFLHHPAHCPHGSPIPPGECCPGRQIGKGTALTFLPRPPPCIRLGLERRWPIARHAVRGDGQCRCPAAAMRRMRPPPNQHESRW